MSNIQVPTFAYEKRLSRIETLRLAITYIGFMSEIMAGTPSEDTRNVDIYSQNSHNHVHPAASIQREFIPPYNHHSHVSH